MVAPLPQERLFKREFDMNRLAALRGDMFTVPDVDEAEEEPETARSAAADDFSPIDTPETRRFFARDSEDALVQQFLQASPEVEDVYDPTLDPANFARMQQQARMAEGIGAPELLDPEIAELPDPESSTSEEIVTYGESVAAADQAVRSAPDAESRQQAGNVLYAKLGKVADAEVEIAAKKIRDKFAQMSLKWGPNAAGTLDEGQALFIVKFLTWLYGLARAVVTLFSGALETEDTPQDVTGVAKNAAKKGIKTLFPVFRPLAAPVDFATFLFNSIIILLIVALTMGEILVGIMVPLMIIFFFAKLLGGA